MKHVIIDFLKIKTEKELNIYLAEAFDLPSFINGDYGYNLSAFWDVYSYSDDNDFIELVNINTITDDSYKEAIAAFIDILNDLKQTNPNFDFKVSYNASK